jgi:hypothetical protein
MLEAIIQDLIRNERPYYSPQGNPIKGLDNQYWLVFKQRFITIFLKNKAMSLVSPCCGLAISKALRSS